MSADTTALLDTPPTARTAGLDEDSRIASGKALIKLLADSVVLRMKIQNVHWNVTGANFRAIHQMTEEQYTDLATAIDDLAERIRALGLKSPGSLAAMLRLTTISEDNEHGSADTMLADLLASHELLVGTAHQALEVAQSGKDEATADMLIDRIQVHDKSAWMIRAMLDK